MQLLESKLIQRKFRGNLRSLKAPKALIDFGSNDSLGLASSIPLQNAAALELETLRKYTSLTGFCSTGSRLLAGNHIYTEKLEESIAHFHGFEAGLLFNCGYMANVGLISSVANSEDVIFYDVCTHASTRDGIRLSKAKGFPFRHNDLDHLEKRLKQSRGSNRCFLCVESVYSTDGSIAPLEKMSKLCERYEVFLIVDETHAIGIFGKDGKGLVAEKGITHKIFALVSSFAKAMGAYGAIVLGSALLKDYLINFAHSFIYTCALPLQNLVVIKCAYDMLPKLDDQRTYLKSLIRYLQKSPSQIQPHYIKGNQRLLQCQRLLAENGFFVPALRSPTVRRGYETLRICLHSFNTKNQLIQLLQILDRWETTHD